MHRSILAAAMLCVAMCTGCGQANPPPPASAPSVNVQVSQDQERLAEGSAASPADNLTSEEMPAEEKADMTDEATGEEQPVAKTAAPQTPSDDAIVDNEAAPAAAEAKGSGKLLRGLGNSLGRALSKTVAGGGDSRPAPRPQDDPFPQGEPDPQGEPKE